MVQIPTQIGDKVWFDKDCDGILDGDEVGAAGVVVTLFDADGNEIAQTVTDANGNYLFDNLAPGSYKVGFEAPTGYMFTHANQGTDDTVDSDADENTGMSGLYTLTAGQSDLTVDAGLVEYVTKDIWYNFDGNSSTDGTDGNSRSYTIDGVTVTGRAFSRKDSNGQWDKAYLGAYNGGHGVTDVSEGSGSYNNTHTIDNVGGYNNYIVYQFSQDVTVDKLFLGYVVNDSDLRIWIGSSDNPITNMSDAILNGMDFTEVDWTSDTGTRYADLNAGGVSGNVLIVAAAPDDDTPEDYFKIQKLCVQVQEPVCASGDCTEIVVEAEDMYLSNYVKESNANASGGSVIKLSGNDGYGYDGYAKTYFDGPDGTYDVTVNYIDENDGYGKLKVTVNGNNVKVINLDQQVGDHSNGFASTTIEGLDLKQGDVVKIYGEMDQGEFARIDSLIFSSCGTGGSAPAKASLGDYVWEDWNHNNVQDAGEGGIAGVKVSLFTAGGIQVGSTIQTDASGHYLFDGLDAGDYYLKFDKSNVIFYDSHWGDNYGRGYNMNDWKWAVKDAGTDDSIDSDVNGDGSHTTNVTTTDVFTLAAGQNDMTKDAGITPIAIDLNGDGIKTVARTDATGLFDLFGNGSAVRSGWLSSEDGFLAIDNNGNGIIDDISELFGGLNKGDGFAKLAAFDSNGDGVVDADDADFSSLLVWQDINGNHSTDDGELMSLVDAGIASLSVSYVEMPVIDAQGNLHLETSSATTVAGVEVDMTDVYFNVAMEDAEAADVSVTSLADLVESAAVVSDPLWIA